MPSGVENQMPPIVVASFYKFTALPDYRELRAPLRARCEAAAVKGTILLAAEGVNATIAGSRPAVDSVLAWLRADPRLAGLEHKEATATQLPFQRLKVRLKREIVTLGRPEADPTAAVGHYVEPAEWNQLLEDPEVLLLDTRNDYEVAIGSFKGAVDPQTASFREFPGFVAAHLDPARHKRVAMFCTGGIRCEKASSYLLSQGFDEVYHLRGGILNYLETVPAEASLWEGECFVFDERVAVGHGLRPGSHDNCRGCGRPLDDAAKSSPHYRPGLCCAHCHQALTPERRARLQARQPRRP